MDINHSQEAPNDLNGYPVLETNDSQAAKNFAGKLIIENIKFLVIPHPPQHPARYRAEVGIHLLPQVRLHAGPSHLELT